MLAGARPRRAGASTSRPDIPDAVDELRGKKALEKSRRAKRPRQGVEFVSRPSAAARHPLAVETSAGEEGRRWSSTPPASAPDDGVISARGVARYGRKQPRGGRLPRANDDEGDKVVEDERRHTQEGPDATRVRWPVTRPEGARRRGHTPRSLLAPGHGRRIGDRMLRATFGAAPVQRRQSPRGATAKDGVGDCLGLGMDRKATGVGSISKDRRTARFHRGCRSIRRRHPCPRRDQGDWPTALEPRARRRQPAKGAPS